MIALSCVPQVERALRAGHEIVVGAYLLHPGGLMTALEDAARRGAHIVVRAESSPYRDAGAGRANASAVARLRSLGADAALVDGLHCKGAA
ncbi:MAG TPA: hypothetical protein VIJ12_04010 [Candidatus Baltobacteraceae bacterium]